MIIEYKTFFAAAFDAVFPFLLTMPTPTARQRGKTAVADYTTACNVNGFTSLPNKDYNKPEGHKARFALYDDG